jgi:hypothetical protein
MSRRRHPNRGPFWVVVVMVSLWIIWYFWMYDRFIK